MSVEDNALKNAHIDSLQENLFHLRKLLWMRHGCDGLYGDDGEMQCNRCQIDFKRDSVQHIVQRFEEIGLEKLRRLQRSEGE